MQQATFFSLVAAFLAHALADQIPLHSGQSWRNDHHPASLGDKDLSEWILDELPGPSVTDHLVFETTHSLLQSWPNTRMRNGHNIVPGTIPNGTLLYHGTSRKELPHGPEWVATDPELSYLFSCNFHTGSESECWHLTLVTDRPLKVVYFDGSSGVKLPNGSFDTQDLILWGRPGDGNLFEDELKRIQGLCEWGKNFGVDGFVRMQRNFEAMLCNFTSGVSMVSFANLQSGWTNQSLISEFHRFEIMNAGSWHRHFPGETRIQLNLAGLISFYDTRLAPSLIPIRAGQERWDHRILNISSDDLSVAKSRLEASLIRSEDVSSGIDWKTLIRVIVDRYANRLELTHYLVNSSATSSDDSLDLAKKAQTQLRIMLTPYLLFSALPTNSSDKRDVDWATPIYKLCATMHTHSMESRFTSFTDSEKLLLQAVRGTSREICRVVTKMWVAGVYAGVDPLLNTMEFPDISEMVQLRDTWAEDLDRLMSWLDWSVWVKCSPGCEPEEMCYLPTWPVGFPWLGTFPQPAHLPPDYNDGGLSQERLSNLGLRSAIMKRLANEASNTIKPEPDEWIRPQPKCIRRIEPYTF